MIRRLLGKCEQRHWQYRDYRCLLGYRHTGDHHFGYLRTPYLSLNLDGPPIIPVTTPPTEPATPPGQMEVHLKLEGANWVLTTNKPITLEQADRLRRAWSEINREAP